MTVQSQLRTATEVAEESTTGSSLSAREQELNACTVKVATLEAQLARCVSTVPEVFFNPTPEDNITVEFTDDHNQTIGDAVAAVSSLC